MHNQGGNSSLEEAPFCHFLWKFRNDVLFKDERINPHALLEVEIFQMHSRVLGAPRNHTIRCEWKQLLSSESNFMFVTCFLVKKHNNQTHFIGCLLLLSSKIFCCWNFEIPAIWTPLLPVKLWLLCGQEFTFATRRISIWRVMMLLELLHPLRKMSTNPHGDLLFRVLTIWIFLL